MSAKRFLARHGMLASLIDPERELSRFLEEMDRVRRGGEGSLKMISTFLGGYRTPERGEKLIVMDIGGTNVRAAVAQTGPEGMISFSALNPFLTPGLKEEMSADEFFRRIAEGVSSQDLWGQADRLGICFSFALNPAEDRDAEVAYGAKQIHVPDLVGRRIGESFRKALDELGKPAGKDVDITVINDASAAALGGRLVQTGKRHDGYLGFIYGTGTNLSYCAKNGEIINVESGAYCSFPSGDIDDIYDRSLIDSGQDRFEKMVSGGYMQGLYDCILHTAVEEGELSLNVCEKIRCSGAAGDSTSDKAAGQVPAAGAAGQADGNCAAGLHPKEISAFMREPRGDGIVARACSDSGDRVFLYELFDLLTRRSAQLCSISITAALLYSESGTSDKEPAFITAEGSAYTGQTGFRRKLSDAMDALAGRSHGLFYEFHTVPDVTFRGTAAACLSS